jgi:hypothetical protein
MIHNQRINETDKGKIATNATSFVEINSDMKKIMIDKKCKVGMQICE